MSMIQWLYRYIFKGLGFVLIGFMITALLVAIYSQQRRPSAIAEPTPPPGGRSQ